MAKRPEIQLPPEVYYNEEESHKYTINSHIYKIQSEMTERALEMLLLPQDECSLILDIGCGSGISSNIVSSSNNFCIGLDISKHMLNELLNNNYDENIDLILCDIGNKMNFRPNVFDGVISISVLQWLFVSNNKTEEPYQRLLTFFKWLYKSLSFFGRACLQFYPDNYQQLEMLLNIINKCNFKGGIVVDNVNTVKHKKYYLCIWSNTNVQYTLPESINTVESEEDEIETVRNFRNKKNKKGKKLNYRSKIIKKKQQQRNKGLDIRPDTKYTGRKRPVAF